jgi:hypothetical protein
MSWEPTEDYYRRKREREENGDQELESFILDYQLNLKQFFETGLIEIKNIVTSADIIDYKISMTGESFLISDGAVLYVRSGKEDALISLVEEKADWRFSENAIKERND